MISDHDQGMEPDLEGFIATAASPSPAGLLLAAR